MTKPRIPQPLPALPTDVETALAGLDPAVSDRLRSYVPDELDAAVFVQERAAMLLLAARYGPASPTEAKVTMTAMCSLLATVGPRVNSTSLAAVLTLDGIARLRRLLLDEGRSVGTVNNRVCRLEQLRKVTVGEPPRRRSAASSPEGTSESPAPYTSDELAALSAAASSHPDGQELTAALTTTRRTLWDDKDPALTGSAWQTARQVAGTSTLAPRLDRARLRATWRTATLTAREPVASLLQRVHMTRTDLERAVADLPRPDQATALALLRG